MTPLIEQIKADREVGSGRDWEFVESVSPDGQEWLGCGVAEVTCDEFVWFEFDPERDTPLARRIARVPALEEIALAAAELERCLCQYVASEEGWDEDQPIGSVISDAEDIFAAWDRVDAARDALRKALGDDQ